MQSRGRTNSHGRMSVMASSLQYTIIIQDICRLHACQIETTALGLTSCVINDPLILQQASLHRKILLLSNMALIYSSCVATTVMCRLFFCGAYWSPSLSFNEELMSEMDNYVLWISALPLCLRPLSNKL